MSFCCHFFIFVASLILAVGAATPFWWHISFSLSGFGTSNVGEGLFQSCFVWFCEFDNDSLSCTAGEAILGANNKLVCQMTIPPRDKESQWLASQILCSIAFVFAFLSIVIAGLRCCKKNSMTNALGAISAILSGAFGLASLFVFSLISASLDFKQASTNFDIADIDLIGGATKFGFSFWCMVAGSIVNALAGIILAFNRS